MLHVPGGQKLPLFHINNLACLTRCDQQIGLAAEEGGDLQDIHDVGGDRALPGFMDIGDQGQACGRLDLLKHPQCLLQAQAATARHRRAIGLIKG